MIRAISSRQAAAKAATGHPVNGRFFCGAGTVDAEDEAVMVTVAVSLLVLYVPTEQVTPASELEAVQVKLGLLEKLLVGVKVSVDVPLLPAAIVKLLGETPSVKPGLPVVKLETFDHVPYTPLVEDKACTCQ